MNKLAEKSPVQDMQAVIGYSFNEIKLLQQSLTHASAGEKHLERLEFLGDAVLGAVIAEDLFCRFPDLPEGALSRMRAALVCRDALLRVAAAWGVDAALNVGSGERDVAGRVRSRSICANAVEAVIGAVFLDGGWDAARTLVLQAWREALVGVAETDARDAKTRLQEYTQSRGWGLPEYRVKDSGAATERFMAECIVRGEKVGEGRGARKKAAEIEAARRACRRLEIK